jgi:hypothetical protein
MLQLEEDQEPGESTGGKRTISHPRLVSVGTVPARVHSGQWEHISDLKDWNLFEEDARWWL